MTPGLPGEDNYTPFDPETPFKEAKQIKLVNNVFSYIFHRLVSSRTTCLRHLRPNATTGVAGWAQWRLPATGHHDGSDGHWVQVLSPELLATISTWIAMAPWQTFKETVASDNQELLGPADYLDCYQEIWAYYMGWKDAREKCHQRALRALDEYYTAFPELLAAFAPQGHGIAASRLPGAPALLPTRDGSPA